MRRLIRSTAYFILGLGVGLLVAAPLFVEQDNSDANISLMSVTVTPQYHVEASNTVRPVTDWENDRMCSAVVVRPGVAYSAAHCYITGTAIDGKPVKRVIVVPNSDAAVVEVPGLECPCAELATAPVVPGEEVMSTGYPQGGERATMGPAKVVGVGTARAVLPWMPKGTPTLMLDRLVLIFSSPNNLIAGMSGGGTFVYRDGRWLLVGTNTMGGSFLEDSAAGVAPIEQHLYVESTNG